jgi:hypothetical protein
MVAGCQFTDLPLTHIFARKARVLHKIAKKTAIL